MKKSLTLLLLLISTVSFSQVFKFGAKAGVNYNNYSPDIEGSESQIAYHFGGFVEYSFNERNDVSCLKAELLLSSEGFKFANSYVDEESLTMFNIENDVKLNYLSLPILYKFRIGEKLYLESGPQINYLISAKENNKQSFNDGTSEVSNDNVNVKDDYKSIKFQFDAGIGYLITENISISARTAISFTEIREDTSSNIYESEKFTNSIIQFSLGYTF
jgi:hypothetical protein